MESGVREAETTRRDSGMVGKPAVSDRGVGRLLRSKERQPDLACTSPAGTLQSRGREGTGTGPAHPREAGLPLRLRFGTLSENPGDSDADGRMGDLIVDDTGAPRRRKSN